MNSSWTTGKPALRVGALSSSKTLRFHEHNAPGL